MARPGSPLAGNAWVTSVGMPDRAEVNSAIVRCRAEVVPLRTVNERLTRDWRSRIRKTHEIAGKGNGVNVSNGISQSARKNTASVSAGANRKQHHKLSKPRARHDMQRQRSEALAQLTRGAERRSAVAN